MSKDWRRGWREPSFGRDRGGEFGNKVSLILTPWFVADVFGCDAVSVSTVIPRFWWVPLSLSRNIELFYSFVPFIPWFPNDPDRRYRHLQSLSLAIAFFNLLPLPHLDGSAILTSFFLSITSSSSSSLFSDDPLRIPFSSPKPSGLLCAFLAVFERRRERDWQDRIIKSLKRSTISMGGVLVICTILVESMSGSNKGVGKV